MKYLVDKLIVFIVVICLHDSLGDDSVTKAFLIF